MSTDHEGDNTPEEKEAIIQRTFLCVVDDSEEFTPTLRYACRRANNTGGRIALLYIIQPAEFQHWLGVGDLMQQESREVAEEMCQVLAEVVIRRTEKMPVIYIREGKPYEVLLDLIKEEQDLSVLVLGSSTAGEGPGPIVSHVVNKMAGDFALPITIVPGGLSDEEIDAIA
ncbi:MAG: universal stress protein [Rhodospirillales bacterium]|nr:universal stress protein [Rhodospirillales bacterium]